MNMSFTGECALCGKSMREEFDVGAVRGLCTSCVKGLSGQEVSSLSPSVSPLGSQEIVFLQVPVREYRLGRFLFLGLIGLLAGMVFLTPTLMGIEVDAAGAVGIAILVGGCFSVSVVCLSKWVRRRRQRLTLTSRRLVLELGNTRRRAMEMLWRNGAVAEVLVEAHKSILNITSGGKQLLLTGLSRPGGVVTLIMALVAGVSELREGPGAVEPVEEGEREAGYGGDAGAAELPPGAAPLARGEFVLRKARPSVAVLVVPGIWAGLLLTGAYFFAFVGGRAPGTERVIWTLLLGIPGILVPALSICYFTRVRLIITNRRTIFRMGIWSEKFVEIPHALRPSVKLFEIVNFPWHTLTVNAGATKFTAFMMSQDTEIGFLIRQLSNDATGSAGASE